MGAGPCCADVCLSAGKQVAQLSLSHACTDARFVAQIHHFLSAISSEPEILSGKITAVLPKDASGLTSVTLENDGDAPELID